MFLKLAPRAAAITSERTWVMPSSATASSALPILRLTRKKAELDRRKTRVVSAGSRAISSPTRLGLGSSLFISASRSDTLRGMVGKARG